MLQHVVDEVRQHGQIDDDHHAALHDTTSSRGVGREQLHADDEHDDRPQHRRQQAARRPRRAPALTTHAHIARSVTVTPEATRAAR